MWKKKGRILLPQTELWWQKSHIMIPTVDYIGDDLFRVFFSGRDELNRSVIGASKISVKDGIISVIEYEKEPLLNCGNLGTFDDNGVTPSCIVNDGQRKFLYYIGWNSGSTTRMGLIAGLAVSIDNGNTFVRNSCGPLLERTDREPYSILTAPFVIKELNIWRMYYVSCEGWINKDLPIYNIKYAESLDGINWVREGHICINFKSEQETALARPCVIQENGIYKMWFSFKDPAIGYRIGYAESINGKDWERIDGEEGIGVSDSGWDSEMVEYSFVFLHKELKYMLYNGNGYGYTGAGYATYS